MARPRKFKESVVISVVVSKEHHDHILFMTRSMIRQTSKMLTISDAVRMALEALYPLPKDKQIKLF